jgi:hypothetical protein
LDLWCLFTVELYSVDDQILKYLSQLGRICNYLG